MAFSGALRSSPSQTWTRRASVEPDLRQDICVEERVDLVSLLSTVAKRHLSQEGL